MPKEAIRLDAAQRIAPLDALAQIILTTGADGRG
jgi:hypothetical protein